MEPSVLHSQTSAFEERNAFLYFMLGLVSLSRSFIEHLEPELDQVKRPNDPPDKFDSNEASTTDLRDLLI